MSAGEKHLFGKYRPQIFDDSSAHDEAEITRLKSDQTIDFIDYRPSLSDEFDKLLPSGNANMPHQESSRWVYYPWRSTVLGLLGPRSYRILRLDRNRNKITFEEQRKFESLTIGVIGMSVGHAVAHTLALEGLCGGLKLADFDVIGLSNLNRIPASVFDLGANKTYVAARRIAELDPYIRVTSYPGGLSVDNIDDFFDGLDIVVEECDSFDIKLAVRLAARERGIPVLMETSDRGLLDVERYDQDQEWPAFHGLLGDVDETSLRSMDNAAKIQFLEKFLGRDSMSDRMASSIAELGATVSSWPQLGSEVQLGGATVAAAVRRLGLGRHLPSGRVRIDVDEIIAGSNRPSARPAR